MMRDAARNPRTNLGKRSQMIPAPTAALLFAFTRFPVHDRHNGQDESPDTDPDIPADDLHQGERVDRRLAESGRQFSCNGETGGIGKFRSTDDGSGHPGADRIRD